jgi:hypothetical protein
MHGTQKMGIFWSRIPDYEARQYCTGVACRAVETMEHLIVNCTAPTTRMIWDLAKNAWPHTSLPWPAITIGIILGIGSISVFPNAQNDQNNLRETRGEQGAIRTLQILITESAYLIWCLRCERAIQNKTHSEEEIRARWMKAIKQRLTDDMISATKIKRDKQTQRKVRATWAKVLNKIGGTPNDWIYQSLNREVLVGMRE